MLRLNFLQTLIAALDFCQPEIDPLYYSMSEFSETYNKFVTELNSGKYNLVLAKKLKKKLQNLLKVLPE
jgi:hypothetical protein